MYPILLSLIARVKRSKLVRWHRLLLFVFLSGMDFWITHQLVQASGGAVYESNPLASAWLSSFGWIGLALFKVTLVMLVAGLVQVISWYRPRVGTLILTFSCCVTGLVVLYSCCLLIMVAQPLAG